MYAIKKSLWLVVAISLLASACKKDEQNVAPTDDNEALTTATLTLTNKANAQDVVTATIENLNKSADFSNATLKLKPNTTYSGTIKEKANEHLFVYMPSTTNLLTVTITDRDTNPAPGPYPVGLSFDLQTGAAATGKLNVRLRHQPNAKNGTPTPGTDDLNTDFPVVIQ